MALLLIPGFMADATLWDDVVDRLEPFGPIHHADLRHDSTLEAMARRCLAAAPAGRLVVVGFSMGGYVARELTYLAPERVAALVLIATSSRPDSAALRRSKDAIANAAPSQAFRGLSRSAVVSSLHPAQGNNDAMIARVRAMGVRLGASAFRHQSMLARPGDGQHLSQITCPTLIVAAGADALRTMDEARELHAGIAGSTLAVIEDSGHMIPIEAPTALAGLIVDWLRAL